MSKSSQFISVILLIGLLFLGKSMMTNKVLYQGKIENPIQMNIAHTKAIKHKGKKGEVTILPKAEYELTGVIKSKNKYFDFPSQISQYDFTMGWGILNKKGIHNYIRYSQSGRWYRFKYSYDAPVSGDYIAEHSANVHIIHKDKKVLKQVKKMKKGDFVKLKGYLVDVDFNEPGAELWQSSLSRSDTGDGACEVFYVEKAVFVK